MDIQTLWLWVLAILIVWLRFPRERRGLAVLHYLVAFVVAWMAFAQQETLKSASLIAAAKARGDIEGAGYIGLGTSAETLTYGWLAALACVVLAGVARWLYLLVVAARGGGPPPPAVPPSAEV